MYDKTDYKDTAKGYVFWTFWGVIAVVIITVVSLLIMRYAGRESLNIDARNRRASYERQDTNRDLMAHKITEFEFATTEAQRNALRIEICRLDAETTGNSPATDQWTAANC